MPKTKVTYSERWHFKVAPEDTERLEFLAGKWGVSRSEAARLAVKLSKDRMCDYLGKEGF